MNKKLLCIINKDQRVLDSMRQAIQQKMPHMKDKIAYLANTNGSMDHMDQAMYESLVTPEFIITDESGIDIVEGFVKFHSEDKEGITIWMYSEVEIQKLHQYGYSIIHYQQSHEHVIKILQKNFRKVVYISFEGEIPLKGIKQVTPLLEEESNGSIRQGYNGQPLDMAVLSEELIEGKYKQKHLIVPNGANIWIDATEKCYYSLGIRAEKIEAPTY